MGLAHNEDEKTYKSTDDFAENNMLVVKPTGLGEKDEELGTVGVWAMVGHGNPSCRTMTQQKFFIHEFVTEDADTYKNMISEIMNKGTITCKLQG